MSAIKLYSKYFQKVTVVHEFKIRGFVSRTVEFTYVRSLLLNFVINTYRDPKVCVKLHFTQTRKQKILIILSIIVQIQ